MRPIGPGPAALRDRWTTALVLVAGLSIVAHFFQMLLYPYGRDQGIYAMVADAVFRGGMPYRDGWDFKPPGIYVIYLLARVLFGPAQWGIRLVEIAALASLVHAATILARRFWGDWRIGLIGGALATMAHAQLEFWQTAQPESFGGVLVVWALVVATSEPSSRTRQLGAWVLTGVLYGAAGLLKPPLVAGAAVAAVFASWRLHGRSARFSLSHWLIPAASILAGVATIVLACALWFVVRGAWGDLYDCLFVFIPNYTRLGGPGMGIADLLHMAVEEWVFGFSSLLPALLLAVMVLRPRAPRERELTIHILATVFGQLVGVALQRKGFPYHYGSVLQLAGLLSGLGAFKLWERLLPLRYGPALFALGALLLLQGRTAISGARTGYFDRCLQRLGLLFIPPSPTERDQILENLYSVNDLSYQSLIGAAQALRLATRPDQPVLVYGFEPVIYNLAARRPATRYLYNVPQRASWCRQLAQVRMIEDLARNPPAAVLVERNDAMPLVTGSPYDSAGSLAEFPALRELLARRYVLRTSLARFDFYVVAPDPARP